MAPEPSFEEFMAARWAALYRTAYWLTGGHHQAEDLLQDVLARTCLNWPDLRDKASAEAYVRRAMVRQASSQWRRRHRESPTERLPETGHGGGLEGRAEHLALWQEIRRLPPRMRATVVLRFVEDRSERETADLLGVSLGSVKSQTHHAVRRLRAALADVLEHPVTTDLERTTP